MKALFFGLGWLWVATGSLAQDIGDCDLNLNNAAVGPHDYRTVSPEILHLVEKAHFTRRVETLAGGQSGALGPDIDYTLRSFPNHPRALSAMSRLAHNQKTSKPAGVQYSVDCWFQRAIQFRPDDAQVRLIYGVDLLRGKKLDAAIEQLSIAERLAGTDPNVHYNLGLAYFDLGDYDKSLAYARTAYQLGFPLPGLREKLRRAGKWKD